ncbi:hypothetical protein F5Y16DRAFT_401070 [Xylariaceae sp. FL0255]|nr:hypothetical protein F5Y16DRAFT_401070 [Xylariaceae sp. FL0255]
MLLLQPQARTNILTQEAEAASATTTTTTIRAWKKAKTKMTMTEMMKIMMIIILGLSVGGADAIGEHVQAAIIAVIGTSVVCVLGAYLGYFFARRLAKAKGEIKDEGAALARGPATSAVTALASYAYKISMAIALKADLRKAEMIKSASQATLRAFCDHPGMNFGLFLVNDAQRAEAELAATQTATQATAEWSVVRRRVISGEEDSEK